MPALAFRGITSLFPGFWVIALYLHLEVFRLAVPGIAINVGNFLVASGLSAQERFANELVYSLLAVLVSAVFLPKERDIHLKVLLVHGWSESLLPLFAHQVDRAISVHPHVRSAYVEALVHVLHLSLLFLVIFWMHNKSYKTSYLLSSNRSDLRKYNF